MSKKKETPRERLQNAYDQLTRQNQVLAECLDRLDAYAVQDGLLAELLKEKGAPQSAEFCNSRARLIREFVEPRRATFGLDLDDIPF